MRQSQCLRTALLLVLALAMISVPAFPGAVADGGASAVAKNPGWMGFGFCYKQESSGSSSGVADESGWIEVTLVLPDGPAWRAGLRKRDLIVEINGQPSLFADDVEVLDRLASFGPGEKVEFSIRRGADTLKIFLVPEEMTPERLARWERNYQTARAKRQRAEK